MFDFHSHPAPYSIDKKAKFSRKRHNEDEGDITYINERNRVFNKKVRSFFFLACYLVNVRFRLRDITTNTLLRFGRALSVELHCSSYTLVPYCTLIQIVLQREFRQHARNGCTTSNKIKTTYLQGTSQSVKQRVRFERTTYELRMAAAVIGSK